MNNQKGVSAVTIIVVVIIFCAVIGGAFLLLNDEKAKTRDAKRMSDMARLQAAFELLYNNSSSYAPAAQSGCDKVGMLASQCDLQTYIPTISQIKDPGKYQYQITGVPDDSSYAVTFHLEKSYDNFSAGKHVLSEDGIK
ncbi:MAG: hypothetical protein WC544_04625 [Patescibacteria group bacterium]